MIHLRNQQKIFVVSWEVELSVNYSQPTAATKISLLFHYNLDDASFLRKRWPPRDCNTKRHGSYQDLYERGGSDEAGSQDRVDHHSKYHQSSSPPSRPPSNLKSRSYSEKRQSWAITPKKSNPTPKRVRSPSCINLSPSGKWMESPSKNEEANQSSKPKSKSIKHTYPMSRSEFDKINGARRAKNVTPL